MTSLSLTPSLPDPKAADRALVIRLLADDSAAWRELMARCQKPLERRIAQVLSGFASVTASDDTAEIFSELCMSLLARDKKKLRAWDPARGASLDSWLYRLATQAAYNHLRRLKRQRRARGVELDDVVCERPSPWELTLKRQREERLDDVLTCLSDREREFYQLYFDADESPEAVATTMNISVATVYSKKHKLMARLSTLVEEPALAA